MRVWISVGENCPKMNSGNVVHKAIICNVFSWFVPKYILGTDYKSILCIKTEY